MEENMIKNLEEKTGISFDEWLKIARNCGQEKHGAIVGFLKNEHGLTHGYANLVAHKAKATDATSVAETVDLVEAQYSKGKEGLRPIYDLLISEIQYFGDDVEIAPKNAYVSLRRNKQFALIQPSTKTRLDLGLNLKGTDASGKLEASGSFNSMCSHRVRLESVADVTNDVISWLRAAYEQS